MARQLVIFQIFNRRFGIDLFAIERVTNAVLVTAVPHAPRGVAGVINVRGEIVPVLDLQTLWGLSNPSTEGERDEERQVSLSDQFLIVRLKDESGERALALWVQSVEGAADFGELEATSLEAGLERAPDTRRFFQSAVKREGEIIFIVRIDALNFSSLDFQHEALELNGRDVLIPERHSKAAPI